MSKKRPSEPPIPNVPTKQDFLEFAAEKEFDLDQAADCRMYYKRRSWRHKDGDPILREHWLSLLETWERNAKAWYPDRRPSGD